MVHVHAHAASPQVTARCLDVVEELSGISGTQRSAIAFFIILIATAVMSGTGASAGVCAWRCFRRVRTSDGPSGSW